MTDMKKMEQYLNEICSDVKSEGYEVTDHVWFKQGLGDVILKENEIKKFEVVIDELCTDDYIKSNFPRSYIQNEFQNIILEALQKSGVARSEFIANELGELRSKLKKDIKKLNFIIPISNLRIENNFSIGNVTFKKFDEVKNIIEKISNPDRDKKLQQGLKRRYKYLAPTCAEVNVQGVPIFAQTKAFNQIRLVVNSLKLYNYLDDPIWGLRAEILDPKIRTIFYYEPEESEHDPIKWQISMEWIGSPGSYEITSEKLEFMNKHHFSKIDEILKKSRNNDLETRLLTSIYWFGESLNTPLIKEEDMIYKKKNQKNQNLEYFRLGERLIKLFTALEAILIFDKTDPIIKSILERTPLLYSTDANQRDTCKTNLEKLYEKRSQIVHYGNTGVSQQDLLILTQIVRTIIFALLKMSENREFKNIDNLKDYLNELSVL